MKFCDIIKAILLQTIDELADNPSLYAANPDKDFTRNRKIGVKDLILMLLTMEGDAIKEEIYRFFGRSTPAPSKSAFYKQRKKLTPEALPYLFHAFNGKLEKTLYRKKYQLIACDGSAMEIFRNPQDPDTFFPPNGKSKEGYNQIHINAMHSILDRRIVDILVQPARKRNEYAAFCEMVDAAGSTVSNAVYMADMGYASYNNYAHVIENGQFFLIRCNDKKLKGILGHPIDGLKEVDRHAELILTRTQSAKKRSRPELSKHYRYICKNVPMDCLDENSGEYAISLRVVRFEIAPGCFENIITNLPDWEFNSEDFKELYHLRWNEETAYRDLKHPLCLKNFHSKKYEYIVQEIWARAILHNFSAVIASEVDVEKAGRQHEYQVNFSEAFKICRDFLRIHDGMTIMDTAGLIAQNVEAIRPGRSFARRKRTRKPFSFCYR